MIKFPEVERSVRELKQQLAEGIIDEKTFEDRLLEMIDVAEDGHYWMFGHKSEKWFRHDGTKWVLEDPDKRLSLILRQNNSPSELSWANHNSTLSPRQQFEGIELNWGWFLISLMMLAVIGGCVYYSVLALPG